MAGTSNLGPLRLAAVGFGVAALLGATVAAGAYLGFSLDQKWHKSPWLTLLGAFAGLIAGILTMLRILARAETGRSESGST